METWRAFITFVNISSQIVQVLGFIRLGRIPKARNGAEAMPRNGTGTRICCQHPLHIFAWAKVTSVLLAAVSSRVACVSCHTFAAAARIGECDDREFKRLCARAAGSFRGAAPGAA